MRILVDADACPVTGIVTELAKDNGISVLLFCDTSHTIVSDYAEVVVVGAGHDAVDFELLKCCVRGDIVVTQDYGLAALTLSKGAYCIHPVGKEYTDDNIEALLLERHLNARARLASAKHRRKGPRARTANDDAAFVLELNRLIKKHPHVK